MTLSKGLTWMCPACWGKGVVRDYFLNEPGMLCYDTRNCDCCSGTRTVSSQDRASEYIREGAIRAACADASARWREENREEEYRRFAAQNSWLDQPAQMARISAALRAISPLKVALGMLPFALPPVGPTIIILFAIFTFAVAAVIGVRWIAVAAPLGIVLLAFVLWAFRPGALLEWMRAVAFRDEVREKLAREWKAANPKPAPHSEPDWMSVLPIAEIVSTKVQAYQQDSDRFLEMHKTELRRTGGFARR